MDKDLMTLPYAESIFVGNANSRVVLSIRKRTFCSTRASENTFLLMTGPKSSSHLVNIWFCQLHRQLISVHSKTRLQYFEVADTAFFLGVEQCWGTIMEDEMICIYCNQLMDSTNFRDFITESDKDKNSNQHAVV